MYYYQALVLMCVFKHSISTDSAFIFGTKDTHHNHCNSSTTLPNYGINITHDSTIIDGIVVIRVLINQSVNLLPKAVCNWTYTFYPQRNVTIRKQYLAEGSNVSWNFSKPGLQKVSVIAQFVFTPRKIETITNCTFVNVADCYLEARVVVLTSAGTYNITQNHTDAFMDSPGLANFSVSIKKHDVYHVCKHLYFLWVFGDGHNASRRRVDHYYNKTGVFVAVLSILKQREGELVKNITLKVHVKEKHSPTKRNDTVVDISLVLAVFFACFLFVICVAAYWFRRRLHRHTEVARFDFRAVELQSSSDVRCRATSGKPGCFNALTCRRGSEEQLLNVKRVEYSSCQRFDSLDLHEEL